jgi:hypothetical protein
MNNYKINMDSIMSIYIPHVFLDVYEDEIKKVFDCAGIAMIKNVDFVYKIGKTAHYSAFVHIDRWYDTPESVNFRGRILNPKEEARIVYQDPWYWIVLPNTAVKRDFSQPKLRINLDGEVTPKKTTTDCPYPIKPSKPHNPAKLSVVAKTQLRRSLCYDEALIDDNQQFMDDVEQLIFENETYLDKYLITIDSRYVNELEQYVYKNESAQANVSASAY